MTTTGLPGPRAEGAAVAAHDAEEVPADGVGHRGPDVADLVIDRVVIVLVLGLDGLEHGVGNDLHVVVNAAYVAACREVEPISRKVDNYDCRRSEMF